MGELVRANAGELVGTKQVLPVLVREDDVSVLGSSANVRAEHDAVGRVAAEVSDLIGAGGRDELDVPAAAVDLLLVLGAELQDKRLSRVVEGFLELRSHGEESCVGGGLDTRVLFGIAVVLPGAPDELSSGSLRRLPGRLDPVVLPCRWEGFLEVNLGAHLRRGQCQSGEGHARRAPHPVGRRHRSRPLPPLRRRISFDKSSPCWLIDRSPERSF